MSGLLKEFHAVDTDLLRKLNTLTMSILFLN